MEPNYFHVRFKQSDNVPTQHRLLKVEKSSLSKVLK